jgi:type IV pilus assembly protein PilW
VDALSVKTIGEKGFSLIELLVALTLGLIMLGSVYSFYVTSAPTYAAQDQLLETQQNLRIALEVMVEDIQSVGGAGVPAAAAITVTNSGVAPDALRLLIPDSMVCPPPKAQVIPIASYNGGAGVMTLSSGGGCAAMAGRVGIVVSADGLHYRTLQVTQVTIASDQLAFSAGASVMSSTGGLSADYTLGTLVMLRQVDYTVDVTDPTKPVLRRDLNDGAGARPIAYYIEDMQLSLGYDRNSDGILTHAGNGVSDDEWVFNVAGESSAGEAPTNLREVRVVLVARTKLSDSRFAGGRPTVLDRGPGAADGYRRRVRETRVQSRNMAV